MKSPVPGRPQLSRLLAGVLFSVLAACPKTPAETSSDDASSDDLPKVSEATTTTEGLKKVTVDFDRNGKPEVVNYYRERADAPALLVRKETDLNRDGKMDITSLFDDAGQRVEETMDGDFDGRPDWKDTYIGGKRTTSEIDTDFNGTFDLVKFYENGKVRRRERDTNADGRPDAWDFLDENGAIIKTGKDVDGDGKMDVRDQ